jgi:hypothetical protein
VTYRSDGNDQEKAAEGERPMYIRRSSLLLISNGPDARLYL